jgi:hypothetical protein
LLVTAVLLALALGNLKLFTSEVCLDETGITACSIYGARALRWEEVEDWVNVPRLIILRGPQGRPQISLFRGEYGFSLEPFEQMRNLIWAKVGPLILEKWSQLHLRTGRSYRYPPLSPLQWVGYLAVLAYGTYLFLIGPVQYGSFGWEQAVYLGGTCLLVSPFLVRDLRRSRRRLMLREDGIHVLNGKTMLLRWDEVTLIVRTPDSIVVEGSHRARLRVPWRMPSSGELLYFIRKNSQAEITDAGQ